MEILKFGDSPAPKRSNSGGRKTGPMIIAGLMVAMMGMSTTLAGTITIGSGNRVEFGQGVVSTAACDSSITITPYVSFNTPVADTFTVNALKLADVDTACLGKTFTIKAYSGGDQMVMTSGGSTGDYVAFAIPGTATLANATGVGSGTIGSSTSTVTGANWSIASGSRSVGFFDPGSGWGTAGTITLTGLQVSADVTRFTIESS